MTNTRFTLEKDLESIRVDKDLLTRIEEYARSDLVKMSGASGKHFSKTFSISIADGTGTEVFLSIKDHRPAQLPDSTQRVSVSFDSSHAYDDKPIADIDVDISFAREALFTRLKIQCSASNARQIALTIQQDVLHLLEPHWTSNRFFHPGPGLSAVLWVVAWLAGVTAAGLFAGAQLSAGSWVLLGTALYLAYSYAGKKLKPWSTFDSRADRSNEEVWRWFKFGVLTFLLFGSLFTLFRKQLVGF